MPPPSACVFTLLAAALPLAISTPIHAQQATPPAMESPSAPQSCVEPCLHAGTLVELEIAEPISSRTRQRGETFALRLRTPLAVDGAVAIPAGTPGTGEIVHADRSRGGGKPGELLLAARYLELDGARIPLRGMKLGGNGKDRSAASLGLSLAVGPFAYFMHGNEIEIPVGALAEAKLAQDYAFTPRAADTATVTTSGSPASAPPSRPATAGDPDSTVPTTRVSHQD